MTKLVIALLLTAVLLQGTYSSPANRNLEDEMKDDISMKPKPDEKESIYQPPDEKESISQPPDEKESISQPPDEISNELPEEEYNVEYNKDEEKYEDNNEDKDNDDKLDFDAEEGNLDLDEDDKKDDADDFEKELKDTEDSKDTSEEEENPETAGGDNIIEGDIELTPAQAAAFKKGGYDALVNSEAWNTRSRWHRYVPYVVHSSVERAERDALTSSINMLQQNTCLRFIRRTNQPDYLRFVNPGRSVCSSPVGRYSGAQTINLGRGCRRATPAHEIMHSLGRFHEQSRPDRDRFVIINRANIVPAAIHNFDIQRNTDTQSVPYDYSSIMHYGSHFFSRNRQPTIVPRQRGVRIGLRDRLSTHDITQLNIRYCPERVVRLARGRPHEGRVEVKWNNRWGTVCDDYFGAADGNVICKYLGYPSVRNVFTRARPFGQGSGPIWFDNMHCRGNEYGPFSCRKNPIGRHNCRHYEDAGVRCNPNVRLAGRGSNARQGRVEVYVNGRWGTVCDDYFGAQEAKVICRQLGYMMGRAYGRARFGQGTLPILLDDLQCTGNEKQIAHCRANQVGHHNCRHHEDASVICSD